MDGNPVLHHIGYVVDSIANRVESFRASVGATAVSEVFQDPIQKAVAQGHADRVAAAGGSPGCVPGMTCCSNTWNARSCSQVRNLGARSPRKMASLSAIWNPSASPSVVPCFL